MTDDREALRAKLAAGRVLGGVPELNGMSTVQIMRVGERIADAVLAALPSHEAVAPTEDQLASIAKEVLFGLGDTEAKALARAVRALFHGVHEPIHSSTDRIEL